MVLGEEISEGLAFFPCEVEEKPYLSHGICEDQLKTLQKIETT